MAQSGEGVTVNIVTKCSNCKYSNCEYIAAS